MLYDTHSHIYLAQKKEKENIIKNLLSKGITHINEIGTDIENSKKSVEFAKKYDFAYASVGIHPSYVMNFDLEKTIEELEYLVQNNNKNIIAIGETGLDYFHIDKKNILQEKETQKQFFIAQINLAKKYNLPLIVHTRDASADTLEILKAHKIKKFVIHCFSGDLEFAEKIIKISEEAKISFTGIITYKNTKDEQNVVANIALEKIMIETDCPYLSPQEVRNQENEPAFLEYILEKIIELRKENKSIIKKQIFKNSLDFFQQKKL